MSSTTVPRCKAVGESSAKPQIPSLFICESPPAPAVFPSKVHDEHRAKLAIVYVRQSTQHQVLEHRESTARQYALADRAVALGWLRASVVVIDDDQGQSGSSTEGRVGFQRLLAEISLDRVGMILGLEMSRLARSCKDWHALLELCAIYRTLLADADGLYDPSDYNDRLLLGLKGTMSEAELHILKSRLQRGMWNKAQRGELLNVKLPVRPHFGPNRGELQWRRANRVTLLNMLHHPIYAGAYRWGHREIDPRKKVAGRPNTGRTFKSHEECRVLIRDRFPAYITWNKFEENQRKLAENQARGKMLSAPRHGPSVLAGLLVCGRCGHRMLVGYANTHATSNAQTLRYSCLRAAIDYGEAKCQSLSGTALETFVVERLLQVVTPASLELSLSAADDLEQERMRLDQQWRQRLERAAYDVELARRQYAAVDPENRLVARELERRWDESLRAHEQLQADYSRFQRECPTRLSDTEREQILALAEDLPTLWQADSTTPEDRQTVARMLLDQVIVSIEGDTDRVDVELCWAGGFTSRHALYRPVQTYKQLSNYEQIIERIDALRAEGKSLASIVNALNLEGFHPPKRASQFTAAMLSRLLRERGVRSGPLPRSVSEGRHLQPHEWWLADLAAELQMPVATMHRWQRVGWVTSRKVAVAQGRWAIFADADELDRLRLLRAARRGWADEPYPRDLITPKQKIG